MGKHYYFLLQMQKFRKSRSFCESLLATGSARGRRQQVRTFAARVSCQGAESVQIEAAAAAVAATTTAAAAALALTHTCRPLGCVCKSDISPAESFSPLCAGTQGVISPESRFLETRRLRSPPSGLGTAAPVVAAAW